jgi:hypothetical protein
MRAACSLFVSSFATIASRSSSFAASAIVAIGIVRVGVQENAGGKRGENRVAYTARVAKVGGAEPIGSSGSGKK